VLKRAIAELEALGKDAPERTLALPLLVKFKLEVPADPAKRTPDDEEFLMDTQDIVERWHSEAVQEGRGRGVVDALIEVYETRFGPIPPELRATIEGTHDEPTLHAWFKLAITRAADEIAAAVRAARAS
jgi:hypothetical protein